MHTNQKGEYKLAINLLTGFFKFFQLAKIDYFNQFPLRNYADHSSIQRNFFNHDIISIVTAGAKSVRQKGETLFN
jgi:hypothetical protein